MKKLFLTFIEHNKLWVTIIVLCCIVVATGYYFISMYQDVMTSKTDQFDMVQQLALEHTEIETIDEIERYHGDDLYFVIKGTNQEGESYVFMHQEEEEWQFDVFDASSFYTKEELLSEWEERCNICEYLGSDIGLDNEIPVLEIKYLDSSERLVYEHVLLEDKTHYRLTLTPSIQE